MTKNQSPKIITLTKNDRKLGILIDPDRHHKEELKNFLRKATALNPNFLLIGSSIIVQSEVEQACKTIKASTDLPLILFPGHFSQLNNSVDAVLLLSLISGRNPDLLIGQHVLAAPILKKLDAHILSTGYILVDGGCLTSVSYISNTMPIPNNKTDICVSTAIAGELIGMKYIYLDAGSGAKQSVPLEMVKAVSNAIDIPLIVGGGIKSSQQVSDFHGAGANLVVVGNALESNEYN